MPITSADIYGFRSKFAEFASVKDPEIALALQVAEMWVDDTIWSAEDYPTAKVFWAAHFLSLKQQLMASAELGGAGSTDVFVRSIGIGERRVMFGERGSFTKGEAMMGPGDALLNRTMYGMIYLTLRARNVPAIEVI